MKQQITKRAITESFRALLAVKPLDKITVRDFVFQIDLHQICDRSLVIDD